MNKHLRNEIELISVVVIALTLLISPFFFSIENNAITGFATGIQTETKTFDIKQTYRENSAIEFNQTKITRLTITGNYIGEGTATIYANVSGTLLKIHEINTKKTQEKNSLTGYVPFEENETKEITQEILSEETNIEEPIVEEIIEEPLTEQQLPEYEEEIKPIETPQEENITQESEEEIVFEEIVEEIINETITEEQIELPVEETPINEMQTEYNGTIEYNDSIEINETTIFENKCIETCNLLDSDITNIIVLVNGLELYIDGLTYIKKIDDFSQIKPIENITLQKNENIILDLNNYFNGENIYYDFSSSSGYNYNISENFLEIQGKEIGTWNAIVYAAKDGNVITSNEFKIDVNELTNITANLTKIDEELLERLRNGESIRVIAKTKTKLETIKIPEQEQKGENIQLITQSQEGKKQLTTEEINIHKGKKILDENTEEIIEIKQETKNTISTEINLEQALKLTSLEEIEHIIIDEPFSTLTQETINITKINYIHSINYSGTGQKICVLDTGVSNSALGTNITGYNFVEDNENINDGHGHGTRVIYSIIQTAPNSEVIAVKVLDDSGNGYSSDILAGLEYCETQNASIISLSIGGGSSSGYCDSDIVASKINELNNAGILVVVATGNDGSDYSIKIPSCASGALPVSASTKSFDIASFSNYNNATLLVAPGQEIITKDISGNDVFVSGTSMSVPFISGTAALLLQNESINPDEIKELLVHTGDLIKYSGRYFAQVNAWNAMTRNITNNLSEETTGLSNVTTENYTTSSIDTITLINPLNGSIIESPLSFISNISGNGIVNATLYTNESGSWVARETRWNGEIPWNDTGLVALWHFNNESLFGENSTLVYDWSGNNISLSCSSNCPLFVSDGRFGSAYHFDTSLSDFTHSDTDYFSNWSEMTVIAWVNPLRNQSSIGISGDIISKRHDGSGGIWNMFYLRVGVNNNVDFYISNATNGYTLISSSSNLVLSNTWTQIVGRYNGSVINIFVNGLRNGSGNFGGIIKDTNGLIYTSYSNFNGSIDEVAIWNRSLSDEEILALYNYSRKNFYPVFQKRNYTTGSSVVWNVLAYDNQSNNSWSVNNFSFTVSGPPNIKLVNPENNNYTESPVTFKVDIEDDSEVVNATLYTNESGSWVARETRWNGEIPWNDTELVALWHFNNESLFGENSTFVYDWSGNGNNISGCGTNGCPVFNSSLGYFSGGFVFNNSVEFRQSDTSLSNNFPGKNSQGTTYNLTIAFWINNSNFNDDFFCKYPTSFCIWVTSGGKLREEISNTETTENFQTNKWVHVAMTYNGSAVKLFVNGTVKAQNNAFITGFPQSASAFTIGGTNGYYMTGSIDEVAIWKRTLSDEEISALYNYSRKNFYPVFQKRNYTTGSSVVWNVLAYDNQSNNSWSVNNFSFTVSGAPVVSLINPNNGASNVLSPVFFESDISDEQEVVNATLYTNESGSWVARETRWNGEVPWNDTGLVLLYHFNNETIKNENATYAYDWSGQGHDLIIVNDTGNRVGLFGGGIEFLDEDFSARGRYAKTPIKPISNFTGNDSFTLSAWVMSNTYLTSGPYQLYIIFDGHYNPSAQGFRLLYDYNNGRWTFLVANGTTYIRSIKTANVGIGEWHHLVGRYNTTHVQLFVDGVASSATSVPGKMSQNINNPNFVIGTSYTLNDEIWNGSIDEVAIWNRSLSDEEILALYNYSRKNFYPVFQERNLSVGTYVWNVLAVDNQSNNSWSVNNFSFTVGGAPVVSLINPNNGASNVLSPVFFESNISDEQEVVNATLYTNESGSWVARETRWNGEVPWNDTGLVALWHFNNESAFGENLSFIYDFIGKYSATCNDENCSTSLVSGKLSNAYYFNGSQYYNFSTNDLPYGDVPRSMCAWAETDSINSGWSWVISYGYPSGSHAFFIGRNGASYYGGGYSNDIYVINFFEVGKWYHLCLTYNSTHATLYGNGIIVAGPTAKTWNTISSAARIGRQVNSYAEYWTGSIDEIAIWNRSLSAEEISALYNYSRTKFYPVFQNRTLTKGTYIWNVKAYDNQSSGMWAASNYTFTIQNSPPTQPNTPTLTPTTAYRNTTFSSSSGAGSTDVDEDSVTYYYNFVNNTASLQETVLNTFTCNTTQGCRKGTVIRVQIRGYDGTDYGLYSNFSNNVTIQNWPPTMPSNLTMAYITYNESITLNCTNSTDPVDNDTIVYIIQSNHTGSWSDIVNGDSDGYYNWTFAGIESNNNYFRCAGNDSDNISSYRNITNTISIDALPPRLLLNSSNHTTRYGDDVSFSVQWNDTNLDACIFEYYNGSTWSNTTNTSCENGQTWTLIKTMTATRGMIINWTWYANDTFGNVNKTKYDYFVIDNTPPTLSNVKLNATSIQNLTTDNLTLYFTQSDTDGDTVWNITDWRRNGVSIALLNLPFNTNVTSGTIKDYSTNNGLVTLGQGNTSRVPQWRNNGKVGGAYYFDGVDDVIQLNNDNGVLNFTNNFSFSIWVNLTNIYTNGIFALGSYNGVALYYHQDNGLYLLVRTTSGDYTTYWKNNTMLNIWVHLAGTFNGTHIIVYRNGLYDNQTVIPYSNRTNTGMGCIGADTNATAECWHSNGWLYTGFIDEFMLFNRTLSPKQIYEIYQAGLEGKGFDTLVSQETIIGDEWTVAVTPSDGFDDGASVTSNPLTILLDPIYVSLIKPVNGNNTVTSPVFFVSNVSDDSEVVNATLYTNESGSWVARETRWNGEVPWNDTGLVALWHFNNESLFGENSTLVYDWSGKGNNATLGGGTSGYAPTWTSNGKVGGAYVFDGTNDYLNVSSMTVGSSWTINIWTNQRNYTSLGQVIWAENEIQPWNNNSIGALYFEPTITAWWFNGGRRISGSRPNINEWAMITLKSNSTHVVMYFNGVITGSPYPTSTNFNNKLVIGQKGIDSDEAYFNGTIDELAIWNRSLSAEEISALYNYSRTKFYPVFQNRSFSTGTYVWNVLAYDNQSNIAWAVNNFSFTISKIKLNSCQELNISNIVYQLSTNISVNGSTCFNVTAQNVTLNCDGYSVTGNNTANTYGVYSNQYNTTVKNCNIKNFAQGIYYYSATNSTIVNTNITVSSTALYPYYNAILLGGNSNYTIITNVHLNVTGTNNSGIFIPNAKYTTINRVTSYGTNNSYGFKIYDEYTIVSNSSATTQSIECIEINSSNNKIINTTLISDGTNNLLYISSISSNNTFILNNFSSTTGYYVVDFNGSNYYNGTYLGKNQGNIWSNVINGSVEIYGQEVSSFTGLYIGTTGSGYPYDNTTSLGKFVCNFASCKDYAPLTTQSNFITVNLTNPLDNWITNNNPIFECKINASTSILNVTLYTNASGTWSANITNSSITGTSVNVRFNSTIFSQGNYTWNCYACTANACVFDSVNRTFYVDIINPSISFVNPTPDEGIRQPNTTNYAFINVSSSDDQGQHTVVLDWNRSLVGWWTFDNVNGTTVYDKSSYKYDGSFQWDTRIAQGYCGKGVYLDGSGDRIHVNDFMDTGNYSEYTMLLWIKLDMLPSEAGYSPVLIRPISAEYGLFLQSTGDVIYLNTNNGSGNYYVRADTSLQKDVWYHVAAIYNGTYAQVYLNGNPDDSAPEYATGPLPHTKGVLQIGGTGSSNFKGIIDEVQIYNRALTPQEINASYNANLYKYYNNFTNLAGGNYSYTAYAVDRAGNANQTSRSFIINSIPTVSNVKLNATTMYNDSSDNLTLYFTQSDADGDVLSNVTDWRINGQSIALLNMPFNTNVSTTTTGAVKDYSTYGNNGTLGGGTSGYAPTWTSNGKVGGAYVFDGTNDYLNVSSMTVGSSWTINIWTNQRNYTSLGQVIWAENEIQPWKNNSIGALYFEPTITAWWFNGGRRISGSRPNINEWAMITLKSNSTHVVMYFNGVITGSPYPTSTNFNNKLVIGQKGIDSDEAYFNGTIDELTVWNRSLSSEQIYAIYQAGLNNHSVDIIVRNETSVGENWSSCVTASDGYNDSETVCSNNVTINNGLPTIISSIIFPTTAYSNDTLRGYCNATDNDALIYYHYKWFLDGVPNATGTAGPYSESININIANISSSLTTKGQEWVLECVADDTTSNSSALNSTTLTILNHPPEQVILLDPSNGNDTITNRTIFYNWTDSSDIDDDPINYSLEVSLNNTFQANIIMNQTGILNSNFTDYTERDSATYYWRVRAFDGTNYSEWSETFNYTLEDYLLVTLTNNAIDFGTLGLGSVQNTTDNTPNPFEFMNKGNVYADLLNITVNKSMWISEPLNTSYSQFRIRNETPFSINQSSSNYSWLYLANYSNQIIANYFDWRTNNNTLKVDMHVEVPSIEPPGIKNTTITFTWVQS